MSRAPMYIQTSGALVNVDHVQQINIEHVRQDESQRTPRLVARLRDGTEAPLMHCENVGSALTQVAELAKTLDNLGCVVIKVAASDTDD